jgi:hypothetical protein
MAQELGMDSMSVLKINVYAKKKVKIQVDNAALLKQAVPMV